MYTRCNGFLSLTLALCSPCVQADDVGKVVDYRQGLMNVYAHNLTSMGNMVKGKTAFDPATSAVVFFDHAHAER